MILSCRSTDRATFGRRRASNISRRRLTARAVLRRREARTGSTRASLVRAIWIWKASWPRAAATISSAGNVTIHSTETLDADVSGSGRISYLGNPTVRQSVSGSGTLRRRNKLLPYSNGDVGSSVYAAVFARVSTNYSGYNV